MNINTQSPIPVKHLDVRNLPVLNDPPLSSYPYLYAPGAIHIRLSAKCNLECDFCERMSWMRGDKDSEKDMSLETWEKIRDKFLPHVRGVEICGLGEPTLSKIFARVAADVVAAGKTLYFPTNGYFLNSKHVLKAVGDSPRVSISIDAWDAESYARIRTGEWDRMIKSVKAFRKAKPNAFLHSQFTAGLYNIDGLAKWMEVCGELGIQETIMRFVQTHTIPREEVSLRFYRERTEKAIYEAQLVAERLGIVFNVERRPYSDFQTESVGPPTDIVTGLSIPPVDPTPKQRLERYLDFAPMSAPTCPGGCPSSTNYLSSYTSTTRMTTSCPSFSTIMSTASSYNTMESNASGTGYAHTYTFIYETIIDSVNTSTQYLICTSVIGIDNGTPGTVVSSNTSVCTTVYPTTCTSGPHAFPPSTVTVAESYICNGSCTTHIIHDTTTVVLTSGGLSQVTATDTTSVPSGCCFSVSNNGDNASAGGTSTIHSTIFFSCGSGTCYVGTTQLIYTGTDTRVTSTSIINDNCASQGFPASLPGSTPQTVRTVKVPRGQITAMSADAPTIEDAKRLDIRQCDAALIIWDNEELTTCFARHAVGTLDADTWESIIMNPRYQAFLHNREGTNGAKVTDETWCANCPRNY